jgi:hypothetical protein
MSDPTQMTRAAATGDPKEGAFSDWGPGDYPQAEGRLASRPAPPGSRIQHLGELGPAPVGVRRILISRDSGEAAVARGAQLRGMRHRT